MSSRSRARIAVLLVVALAAMTLAPPVHVHASDSAEGRRQRTTHSHPSIHAHEHHSRFHQQDAAPSIESASSDAVQFLDSPFVTANKISNGDRPLVAVLIAAALIAVPARRPWSFNDEADRHIHGPPPDPTDSRGPPSIIPSL